MRNVHACLFILISIEIPQAFGTSLPALVYCASSCRLLKIMRHTGEKITLSLQGLHLPPCGGTPYVCQR